MPRNAVKVSRPGPFGNPVSVGTYRDFTPADAVAWFRDYVKNHPDGWLLATRAKAELRGKNLACWCPIHQHGEYAPCHADVLLSIANDMTMEEVRNENIRRATGETDPRPAVKEDV